MKLVRTYSVHPLRGGGVTSASCVVYGPSGQRGKAGAVTSLKQQMAVFPNLNLHQAPTANENCYKQLDDSLHFSTFYSTNDSF